MSQHKSYKFPPLSSLRCYIYIQYLRINLHRETVSYHTYTQNLWLHTCLLPLYNDIMLEVSRDNMKGNELILMIPTPDFFLEKKAIYNSK